MGVDFGSTPQAVRKPCLACVSKKGGRASRNRRAVSRLARRRATSEIRPRVSNALPLHCFPQCSRAIHSTRVKNLRLNTPSSTGRNSGVRRQNAVSSGDFSRSRHLKKLVAANQGWTTPWPLTGPGMIVTFTVGLLGVAMRGTLGRLSRFVRHRRTKNPSVLSSLLSGSSLPGRCKRSRDCLAAHGLAFDGSTYVRSFDRTTARLPSALYLDPAPPLRRLW